MTNPKERLLSRLPKKYHNRVVDLTQEDGLIDDCKYVLQYAKGYTDGECEGGALPCKSVNEAVYYVRYVITKAVK